MTDKQSVKVYEVAICTNEPSVILRSKTTDLRPVYERTKVVTKSDHDLAIRKKDEEISMLREQRLGFAKILDEADLLSPIDDAQHYLLKLDAEIETAKGEVV
jgi:hypothetical protein